ncbi:MAG: hypothetical protein IJC33_00115 [Clostridia bacterium]|nr:hypothetical protein [Clostridia bacterium]
MKNSIKTLLSALCALALLAGLAGMLPAAAEDAAPAEQKTLYQQILERDGFIEGVWYPWFTHNYLGSGLTANEVAQKWIDNRWYGFDSVGIDAYGADKIYKEIYNLKALGFNMLAYAGSPYSEGVVFDDNGDVIGIKEDYLANTRRLLEMCRQIGMPVMWNILFHSSSAHDYYGHDAWVMMTQMYSNPIVADHYAERFVRPLCRVLAEFPDVVALIALTDEIENEMNDTAIGNKTTGNNHSVSYGVTKADMLYLMTAMNDVVKEELPDTARTVAANFDDLGAYSDLDLDVMGRNRYDNNGGCGYMQEYYTTVPMLLTEFNVGDGSGMSEQQYLQAHLNFRNNMKERGYQGGFLWCWQPNTKGATHDLLAKNAQTTTDFRDYVYELRHYTLDCLNEYRGEETVLDAPVLFYVNGINAIEWIPSRQATRMDLLRSTDGGKTWKKVLDNVSQSSYLKGYKCSYTDTTTSLSAIYKIVVRDDQGHTAESAVSNQPMDCLAYVQDNKKIQIETIKRPYAPMAGAAPAGAENLTLTNFGEWNDRPASKTANLIHNGSFENDGGGQWNNSAFLRGGVQVVEDPTAPEGSRSLFFNSSGSDAYAWHTFTVDVQPNTDYIFSTWIKGDYISADNRFAASIGVINPKTQTFMIQSSLSGRASRDYQQIYPKAWDTHWGLRSVGFNSGNHTQITIGLLGRSSRMWVDGLALYKASEGTHYLSEEMKAGISYYMVDYGYCEDAHSQTENIRMDDAASDYWQSGSGWDSGVMSLEQRPFEYGTSLKYTGNESSMGAYYIKWIDVKPYTDYVFSMNVRILEDGFGKLSLLADKISGPVGFYNLSFDKDTYGEGWFPLVFGFNTDAITRIGFAVLDKGGEALFDNIRLFEESYGIENEEGDPYIDPYSRWTYEDGKWCYYSNGEKITDVWRKDGAYWRYIGKDGYCVANGWAHDGKGWIYQDQDAHVVQANWVYDGSGWYYLDKDGYMVSSQWKKDSVGWCYLTASGRMATNAWVMDSVGWCYVGADGYCVTNKWVADSKGWCYLDASGRMATNKWIKDSVGWCYVGGDGYCVTNKWVADSKGWCYLDASGRMVTNKWVADSKGWCYVDGSGYCKVNAWQKDSKGWCYLDQNGRMVYSQWVEDGGKRYYVNASGYMVFDTILMIDGVVYSFDRNGATI